MNATIKKQLFPNIIIIHFWILLLSCSVILYSQSDAPDIRFDNISIKDGLSQSSPNCIFQDSHGLIWIGTEDGLNKYDGYNFTVYRPDQNNRFSISNPRILAICADSTANLWIGTNGGGINMYDRVNDRFYSYQPEMNDSVTITGKTVYSLISLQNGTIWIGTENGLSVFSLKNDRFIDLKKELSELQPLANTSVFSIIRDEDERIWIGTEKGLFSYDQNKKELNNYYNSSLPGNVIKTLMVDRNRNLWIGSVAFLAKLERVSGTFTTINNLPTAGTSATDNQIKALLEDNNGHIWIGTNGGGLIVHVPETGEFYNYSYDHNNPYSLRNNEVLSMFQDFSGIIWVGTNGLDKYNQKKDKFKLYDYVPFTREKLIFRNIHPIYEDQYKVLWIGSKTDGLHMLDRNTKKYIRYTHELNNSNSLSSNRIRAIKEYPEGILWVGTEDQGLNKIYLDGSRRPVRFKSFKHNINDSNSITSNKIYALYIDENKKLWIGTDNGLTIMNIESETFSQYAPDPDNPNSLSNSTVYCIYGDRTGDIWLATNNGINKFNPATNGFIHYIHNDKDSNSLINNEILTFQEDRHGNLWIGTYGKGLDKYDKTTNTFTHFSHILKLSTSVIYGILEDESGYLWISTNNGILKFNPADNAINLFTIDDGLQSNEFNGTSYFKSHSGEMFFGGQYGFNSFYPKDVKIDSIPPKIILSDLQVHNISVIPGENSPIKKNINEVKEILLNHKQNNFTLYFSALHFANPAKNHYKCKLEGFDRDWIDIGDKRFVSYTNLPYKTYNFIVIASNSDGIWNEEGIAVKIRIRPPFWATIWFRTLMAILIISGIIYLLRKRLEFVQKQKEIFEKKFESSSRQLEEAKKQLEIQHEEITIQKRELKLRENDQENLLWFNQGLGIFSDIISKHKDDLTSLCQITIDRLVEYVDAQQGAVFLLNDEKEDDHYLELIAHYAFSNERIHRQFKIGEGYVGTCFYEKQFMEIDNLTEKYSELHSGLGNQYLKHLLFAPLKINEQCIGVVELGSFKKIKGYRVSFIEKLMETFASIINTQRANVKLKKLIEFSTAQTKELEEREEQLRLNLEEIMATQEESTRREDELIRMSEQAASHEENLKQQIEVLKNKIKELTGKPHES
jgi:two-component system sensor histidine kinase ChiS